MSLVGWIGLGAMGAPMAAVVARTRPILAFDIDPAAVDAVVRQGARPAASIAEAAAGVDVLAIMVATESQVDAVLFGDGGAAAALAPGAVVLVMATVGPAPIARWSERLAALGVSLVDAPVSGGVARAAAGDLLMMVSGAPESVAAVSGVLDALARDAPVVGAEPGEGQKVKLVNQLLCGIHIAAAGEALAFAEALGLDARACWEVIRRGAAASFMLDDRGERMLDGAFEVPKSAVDIFVKDLGLVVDAAEASGAWTPIASSAERLYVRAHDAGLGRKDDSVLIDVLRSGA